MRALGPRALTGGRMRALGPRALTGGCMRVLGPRALTGGCMRVLGPRALVNGNGRVRLGLLQGLAGAWVAGLVGLSPVVAQACAVCSAGRDEENQLAFLLSTIGMSLMPLIAIGTLVFVLWRRIQKLEAGTEARRAAAPLDPHPPQG